MQKTQRMMLVAATLTAFMTMPQAPAAEVDVPAGALAPNTSFVMWGDVAGFNEQAVRQAMEAVIQVAPTEDRDRMRQEMDEQIAEMQPVFDAAQQLEGDGVHAGLLTMAFQDDVNAKPLTQMFVQADAGADPKAAIERTARAMNQMALESGEGDAMPEEELEQKLASMKLSKVSDTWHAVEVDGADIAPLPAEGEAVDPAPFAEALSQEEGAPVRFAWVMSDAARDQLKQAAADPGAAMVAGVLQPLTSLKTASGGMWLGDEPKMRMSMNFADEAAASSFKVATDGMINMFAGMMAMQAAQAAPAEQAPDQQKIQAVIPMLFFDQSGTTVSKSFDPAMLQKLTEAGIPWSKQ